MRTRAIATSTTVFALAVLTAALTTFIARVETFVEPTRLEPGVPAPVTLRFSPVRADLGLAGPVVSDAHARVGRGAVVAEPGDAALVRAYEDARRPPGLDELLGLFSIHLVLFFVLGTWLRMLSSSRGQIVRTHVGGFLLLAAATLGAKVILLVTDLGTAVVPIGMLALWARVWIDRRTGFVLAVVAAGLVSSLVDFDPVTATVLAAMGMTPVLLVRDKKRNVEMLPAGIVGGIAGAFAVAAARVLFVGHFDLAEELRDPWRSEVTAALASGLASGLGAWLLHGLSVHALGAVSRTRLLELSDIEHPLLKRMATEAPGSWEHARAMANLAEAAVAAIRGDSLLVRVGAYYHDLGKTIQPKFFVENLARGEPSPHADLEPHVSADAIKAHVVEGVEILRQGGIPEPVVEFAYTHHGTSIIEYFWHQNLARGNPKGLDDAFFRYPGMRPRTKETAVLMLVDAIEAASRTIDPPDREKFEEMVQRIVFSKLRQGQLDESGLTTQDLRVVTSQLVETLTNLHHSRIRYPWQDKKNGSAESSPAPGVATEADVAEEVERANAEDVDRDAGEPGEAAEGAAS